jgi:hypothetical protein
VAGYIHQILGAAGQRIASEKACAYRVDPQGKLPCYAARKSRIRLLTSVGR